MNSTYEYRVTWMRPGWTQPTTKLFQSHLAAKRFVDTRLFGGGRPDLAPLEYARIESRRVGPWGEMPGGRT